MNNYLIRNARIVNEGNITEGDVWIKKGRIEKIGAISTAKSAVELDVNGSYLIPGMIDDQVHFREPGLTHKANIYTESRAAVAGGITSFMEMPNTSPQTLTQDLLAEKYHIAAQNSPANYSFYMGVSNHNLEEALNTNNQNVCGLKVFMGSSTGDMLVDNRQVLEEIFSRSELLIATHCEDEETIRRNMAIYTERYGDNIPIHCHPEIRSEEACYISSSLAVELAKKHNTRLHILHISTGKETFLFDNNLPLEKKRITAEACVHHLWFNKEDYDLQGSYIKWNPAVKTEADRKEILSAVLDDRIDVIATDHAPHTLEEKNNLYAKAPSGGPLVQHCIPALFELHKRGEISVEQIVQKTAHNVAICFQLAERGFIREGYWADLAIVNPNYSWIVEKSNILYKCGWSPFEGQKFSSAVTHTFVNGRLVYENGKLREGESGMRLLFNR